MTPEAKTRPGVGAATPDTPRRDTTRPPQSNATIPRQQRLSPAPPPTPEEQAIRALLHAFGSMLLEVGHGSLSDARKWLPDSSILAAIRPHVFGSIPARFGKSIRAREVGRASHPGGGNHFCLVYEIHDPDRLRGMVAEMKGKTTCTMH